MSLSRFSEDLVRPWHRMSRSVDVGQMLRNCVPSGAALRAFARSPWLRMLLCQIVGCALMLSILLLGGWAGLA